jgi:hypothetical protein
VWDTVDRLIDAAPDVAALRAHKLQLLAARRWREQGATVPDEVAADERRAVMVALVAPALLARAASAAGAPVVLLKGPEAAARYPDPRLRGYIDLDLLVADVAEARRRLLAAGFEEGEDPPWASRTRNERADPFANKHHARPVYWPGIPVKIELHHWPNWPRWLTPPSARELLSAAVPSAVGVDGVLTLPPAHHALLLAAHAWVDEPLARIRDLLDVAVMAEGVERGELDALAARWGMRRLWRTTIGVADALFDGKARRTLAQRTWARNLAEARERTVFETHLESWVSAFWSVRFSAAARLAAANIAWDLRPAADESWRAKMGRALRAARHWSLPKSLHDERAGEDARRLSPPTRWRKPPGPSQL